MSTEMINCPYCGSSNFKPWAEELGFTTVRCECRLLYVNPRPTQEAIHIAVSTGIHSDEAGNLNAKARRTPKRIGMYRKIFARMYADVWARGEPISWLDIGAGYGEILEAITSLAAAGSRLEGLEPMHPKAVAARKLGLTITEDYLRPTHEKVQFTSSIDVLSHIPDYGRFLNDVVSVLAPGGELFVETGNLADLEYRSDFMGELGTPDHLVFVGMEHLRGYLDRAGFDIVTVEETRHDGLIQFAKNVVKRILGRPITLVVPYTSRYRQILVRARLRQQPSEG